MPTSAATVWRRSTHLSITPAPLCTSSHDLNMKSGTIFDVRLCAWIVALPLVALVGSTASATVQPAWLVRFNAGLTYATNKVVQMVLDGQGNIVVTGSSTGAAGDYDYL